MIVCVHEIVLRCTFSK